VDGADSEVTGVLREPGGHPSTTAEIIREAVDQLAGWFQLPRYQAERLQKEMAARGLHIIEYVQETLARRYETLADAAADERGRRR